MRNTFPEQLERGRVREGRFASDPAWGAYGCFFVHGPCGEILKIIASGGDDDDPKSQGWEHVSISLRRRTPNWREMCFVKDLFWNDNECVVQFHPPKSEYVNQHPFCLHLFRHRTLAFPMPPSVLVGVKDVTNPTFEELEASKAWAS